MISIQMATVTGYEKSGVLLGLENIQIVQVIIEDDIDATPAILVNPAGDESAPQEGDRVSVLSIGNFRIALGGLDSVTPTAEQGERKLYSKDSAGEIAAFLSLLSSGQMQLNGTGDFAVRFLELESGFNELKDDHNNFLTHVHGAAGTPPTPPALPSTASISDSKIENIEVSEL